MAADQAPRSRTRRYIYGGLMAAGAVAIGLALIFTVGGVGKEAKSATPPAVSSLDDKAPGIADVLKDLVSGGDKPAEEPAVVTPVTPATTPAAPTGVAEKTFGQVGNCRPGPSQRPRPVSGWWPPIDHHRLTRPTHRTAAHRVKPIHRPTPTLSGPPSRRVTRSRPLR